MSNLQIKLISEKYFELIFQGVDLTVGVKSLLNFHIQVLHDESPLKPMTLLLPVTGRDEPWPSTSDVITFDQNWHHLYSTSAGGKDLPNDAQISVIGRMEPEIYTKMLKKLSKKTQTKIACHYTWLSHGKNCLS